MAVSDRVKLNMIYRYIKRYGTKNLGWLCVFDPENSCDMLCPALKVKIITKINSSDSLLLAECFCTKFDPPVRIAVLKIRPLDEEAEG